MRHQRLVKCVPFALATALLCMAVNAGREPGLPYTIDFGIERSSGLVPDGGNAYFSLNPGRWLRLEGEDDGQHVEIEVTVLEATRPIRLTLNGVRFTALTRAVEEREWTEGELLQVSINYYARCLDTGNIYYFGEDVEHYENGIVVSREDSWLAGRNGARPGLMMPGAFLLGSRYYQEQARESQDRAENVASGLAIKTDAGAFENCVMVLETTPLEPEEETLKIYALGIGLIADGDLTLVDYIIE